MLAVFEPEKIVKNARNGLSFLNLDLTLAPVSLYSQNGSVVAKIADERRFSERYKQAGFPTVAVSRTDDSYGLGFSSKFVPDFPFWNKNIEDALVEGYELNDGDSKQHSYVLSRNNINGVVDCNTPWDSDNGFLVDLLRFAEDSITQIRSLLTAADFPLHSDLFSLEEYLSARTQSSKVEIVCHDERMISLTGNIPIFP